jgi:hypothetical protein
VNKRPDVGDLKQGVLTAALSLTEGDLLREFSFEELLVQAWERDPLPWGLRGFERVHPDAERLHRELDSRGKGQTGLVDQGYFEKVRTRIYRLTPKGLAEGSLLSPGHHTRERVDRQMAEEVRRVLEHPVFVASLKESRKPLDFRLASSFWNIAPGTPPRVIADRVRSVEETLGAALRVLDAREVEEIGDGRGRRLYDRTDIVRCIEFAQGLRRTFAKELKMLAGDALEAGTVQVSKDNASDPPTQAVR